MFDLVESCKVVVWRIVSCLFVLRSVRSLLGEL